ncbi:hypothetical protein AXG89_36820 [Burkholderia sp. PAMC 26561]|nr:hypothetical protein AXG89_36820 [Burkholderia sp. PAMC 26561]
MDQGVGKECVRTAKYVFDWGRFLQIDLWIAALEIDDLRRRVATLHSKFLKKVIVAMAKECNVTSIVSSPV